MLYLQWIIPLIIVVLWALIPSKEETSVVIYRLIVLSLLSVIAYHLSKLVGIGYYNNIIV